MVYDRKGTADVQRLFIIFYFRFKRVNSKVCDVCIDVVIVMYCYCTIHFTALQNLVIFCACNAWQ